MVGCEHKEAPLGEVVRANGALPKIMRMEPVTKAPPRSVKQCWAADGGAIQLQRWWCVVGVALHQRAVVMGVLCKALGKAGGDPCTDMGDHGYRHMAV